MNLTEEKVWKPRSEPWRQSQKRRNLKSSFYVLATVPPRVNEKAAWRNPIGRWNDSSARKVVFASSRASKEAVSSLELAVYSESGEKTARRSLQKPLTIMNESQILDEYEQPSFNTTIDEQDLPVIYHCSSALFR
jgi:hypothetical protein